MDTQFYITHFLGKAFIVFQYQHFAHVVKEKIDEGKVMIGQNKLEVEWAQYPRDIYWANLSLAPRVRNRREVVTLTILLGTVFFSFVACLVIQYYGSLFKPA